MPGFRCDDMPADFIANSFRLHMFSDQSNGDSTNSNRLEVFSLQALYERKLLRRARMQEIASIFVSLLIGTRSFSLTHPSCRLPMEALHIFKRKPNASNHR